VTIVSRRRIYWSLFIAACLCLAAAFVLALPLFGKHEGLAAFMASDAFKEFRFAGLSLDSQATSALAILIAACYAALCLGFILATFRKTVSAEIFFFAFWVLSFGFEAVRLLVFHFVEAGEPIAWSVIATKVVLGARMIGLFSFFAAGIYAAGFRNEKFGSAIILVIVIGWALAYSLPIDTGVFEPTLIMRQGYATLSSILAIIIATTTAANFLYASFSNGEPSYRAAALGSACALVGQSLLISRWMPVDIIAGSFLLIFGSWLFVSRLHAYYLWQ
jgi:hypothetical protein